MKISKKVATVLLVGFCLLMGTVPAWSLDPKVAVFEKAKFPDLTEPEIQISELTNGAKLYYLKDNELPVVRMNLYFKTGTVFESDSERGLTGVFIDAWQSGGTTTRKAEVVERDLELLAATVDGGVQSDLMSLQFRCLEKDIGGGLAIFFDIARNPGFEADRVDLIKKAAIDAIKRRNEEALQVAIREFRQGLYGAKSPLAWLSTPETIGRITRDRLVAFYDNNIAPNQLLIAATSPLPIEEFKKLLETNMAGWQTTLPAKKWPIKVAKQWEPDVAFFQKEGQQTAIVVGHFGEERFNKDKFKLLLANEVLGGSTFGSRLGTRLRSQLGLVYSIKASFGFETVFGPFVIYTKTKAENTLQAINEIISVFSQMVHQKNITQEELDAARERVLNRLVFELDKPFDIVARRLEYDYYGYPPNYLAVYQKEIEKVDLEGVRSVLEQYYFPERLKMVLVGDKVRIPGLESLEGLKEVMLDEE